MNKKYFFFILLILFSLPIIVSGQRPILRVKRIGTQDGLSLNTITCSLKDSKGYLWFGTSDGLNKYNGYEFQVFKNIKNDSTSLPFNHISSIAEDKKGRIWVGTNGGGLCLFDRATNRFKIYHESPGDFETLSNNTITDVYVDRSGKMWVGTYWGLNLYNETKDKFTRFYTYDEHYSLSSNSISKVMEDAYGNLWVASKGEGLNLFDKKNHTGKRFQADGKKGSLSSNTINNLLVDRKGRFWVATANGLNLYHPETGTFSSYYHDLSDPYTVCGNNILSLDDDKNGNLWIGTNYEGLSYFDTSTGKFYSYWAEPKDPEHLSSNSALTVLVDDQDILWIGTNSGGINKFDPNLPAFVHMKTNLQTLMINAFAEDSNGNLWIGTDGSGIDLYNEKTGEISNISSNGRADGLSNNGIVCLFVEKSGNIWVGTFGGGLNYYDIQKNRFYHYDKGDKAENLSNSNIYSIAEDNDGKIWIGTLGGGVNVLDKTTGKIAKFYSKAGDLTTISSDYISSIAKDKNGEIWIGTYGGGVNVFSKSTNTFSRYIDNYSHVGNNQITCIYPDSSGNIWIGTGGNGLVFFDKPNKRLESYQSVNTIASNFIKAINEDNKGNLWISTNNGLARLDLKTKTYKNFDIHDGLQEMEFRERSTLKMKTGQLVFGGINGFNLFDPEKIVDDKTLPQVVLTGFEIFNKPVQIGVKESPLSKDISETQEIVLSHVESVFTITFAGLNYTLPEKNNYAYYLDGFDKSWRFVGKERKATYTNLYPGTYYFKVKACNKDGVWNNKPTVLKITILPPWWLAWWFYTFIAASIIIIVAVVFQLRTKVLRTQQRLLKEEVEKRTDELFASNQELSKQAQNLETLYTQNKTQGEKMMVLYQEIKDSIRAAREIQQSILPSNQFIRKYLKSFFILNLPKDVVSGDFYWFSVKNNKIVIAAVDCTGHGVSGAFMSINGHHLLNQAIHSSENIVASEILDRVNTSIKNEVEMHEDLLIENGFDIGLCVIDKLARTVEFSGAKHPLYILRNKQIIQLKGDKFSIGTGIFCAPKNAQKFTNYLIELQKGDILYMFSDGYPDQIGGEEGDEKFLHIRLKELLISVGEKAMEEQHKILEDEFLKWKGNNDQLDDVLVIGVKI